MAPGVPTSSPVGIALAIVFYGAFAAVLLRVFFHVRIWLKAAPAVASSPPMHFDSAVMAGIDMLFLRRLFLTNKCLWIGEWIFHVSFIVVAIGHLRYVLDPTPAWIGLIRPFVVFCGYALFFSMVYILIYRMVVPSVQYASRLNRFLTWTLATVAGTGLTLRVYGQPDLVAIKAFVLDVFSFSPGPLRDDYAFAAHAVTALVFIAAVPSHVLAAPATILEARRREDERDRGLT